MTIETVDTQEIELQQAVDDAEETLATERYATARLLFSPSGDRHPVCNGQNLVRAAAKMVAKATALEDTWRALNEHRAAKESKA